MCIILKRLEFKRFIMFDCIPHEFSCSASISQLCRKLKANICPLPRTTLDFHLSQWLSVSGSTLQIAIFWQAVKLSQFFPPEKQLEETGSFKWNIYTTSTTHLSDLLFTGQNMTYANRFHQIREMKSNRLLFLLNTLPPTRILDSKIKTPTPGSRVLMT